MCLISRAWLVTNSGLWLEGALRGERGDRPTGGVKARVFFVNWVFLKMGIPSNSHLNGENEWKWWVELYRGTVPDFQRNTTIQSILESLSTENSKTLGYPMLRQNQLVKYAHVVYQCSSLFWVTFKNFEPGTSRNHSSCPWIQHLAGWNIYIYVIIPKKIKQYIISLFWWYSPCLSFWRLLYSLQERSTSDRSDFPRQVLEGDYSGGMAWRWIVSPRPWYMIGESMK